MSGVSAMSDRIRVIIKDSGRMLNEMSDGNFAIDTECEEVYTGAFTDLLTGIRKMNEEIATTVRGVDGGRFLQVPQILQKQHSL